jgi:nucleotide-binding universal stress UspA family protein
VFHRILVPTDGSEGSIHAAQLAVDMLRGGSGTMALLFVVDAAVLKELHRFGERTEEEVEHELRDHGRRYLDLLQAEAAAAGVATDTFLREGDPFAEIVALARDLGADLIVMGHVGQRGTRRVLLGSVTQRVLDFAHCPVLVVKGPMAGPGRTAPASRKA